MSFTALDAIAPAFQHTKEQLFTPFRFGQWARLAIVGLLAGELGSGGSSNFNPGKFRIPQHPGIHHFQDPNPDLLAKMAALGAALAVVVIAALVLGILLMYVSSVMRFILFDSVLVRECHIRLGWSRRQGPGVRLFLWKLGFGLVTLASFMVLVGVPAGLAFVAGWLRSPRDHVAPLVLGGILLFFVLALLVVVIAVVYVLTKDFVVPQMALENIGAMEGWRRLWTMIGAEKGQYAGYIGMKILMAIGVGILIAIVTVILGLLIAIPTLGLGLIAVITGQSAGLTWNAYTITLAIVVGSILLVGFFYLVSLISVPAMVFFPAYSIYFFAMRYAPLHAALYPQPAPEALRAARPQEPPPLPPAPQPAG
ncbi:MAG: hypothetical protein WB510_08890 [Candidatus Sulfotelmatobacter sp.]